MRGLLKTLALGPALGWAAAVPRAIPRAIGAGVGAINPKVLELDSSNAQAVLSVPCPSCGGLEENDGDDDAFIFNLQALRTDQPCGASNLTINGNPLYQDWTGVNASGNGTVTESSRLELRSLDLSWNTSCLQGDLPITDVTGSIAQLLSVTINRVNGQELDQPIGFRVSYRHLPVPQLLRLSTLFNLSEDSSESQDEWRDPPAHLRIDLSEVTEDLKDQFDSSKEDSSVQHDIEELRLLQAQAKELRELIVTKEKDISRHLGQDVFTLKEKIDQCDTIGCVLKAVLHKAHGAIKVMYVRLSSHGTHDQHVYAAGKEDTHWNSTRAGVTPLASTNEDVEADSSSPSKEQDHPIDPKSHLKAILVVCACAVVAALTCGGIFIVLRGCCCNPRSKVERRARREERRTERLYRRAARRQRWKDWWSGRDPRIGDYEEKRALILEQEGLLEEVMQEEIRQFRDAHQVVNGLVNANTQEQNQAQQSRHDTSRRSSNASDQYPQPLSRTSSLPSYTTEPGSADLPGYEDDGSVVANGFAQYTPSSSSDHAWTPASSIINVSPRQSSETMRTKYEQQDSDDEGHHHEEPRHPDHE
ncbi:MAG: hypothetical protein M1820_005190 [Bogoriella megaspora]|nr:MAG: hypothetical protein M1820_005190 [Bogoriella megaspora]